MKLIFYEEFLKTFVEKYLLCECNFKGFMFHFLFWSRLFIQLMNINDHFKTFV